jgi:hypothetical protein
MIQHARLFYNAENKDVFLQTMAGAAFRALLGK